MTTATTARQGSYYVRHPATGQPVPLDQLRAERQQLQERREQQPKKVPFGFVPGATASQVVLARLRGGRE